MARASLAAIAVVAATASSCGSGKPPPVQLEGGTAATGGKAIVLDASTEEKLASQQGGVYAVELRGIDKGAGDASFDRPGYVDKTRCVASPCTWTVVPAKASTYEYKAFLVDLRNGSDAGASDPVRLDWTAPPRPEAIRLFVNGKTPPTTPLTGEDYSKFPAGPLHVEAKWQTDAGRTGYYVQLSIGNKVYAKCSTGTSCPVPEEVPLAADDLMSWTVQLLTSKGDKVADGFKVCLDSSA
jgi:hypothetical protein